MYFYLIMMKRRRQLRKLKELERRQADSESCGVQQPPIPVVDLPWGTIRLVEQGGQVDFRGCLSTFSGFYPWHQLPVGVMCMRVLLTGDPDEVFRKILTRSGIDEDAMEREFRCSLEQVEDGIESVVRTATEMFPSKADSDLWRVVLDTDQLRQSAQMLGI